jgi:alanine racemase
MLETVPLTDFPTSSRAAARAGAVLTIDTGALARNYSQLVATGAADEVAAVIKADGYGLGAAIVGPALWEAGARLFFVAHLDEGLDLRQILPQARIGILNGLMPGCEADYDQASLMPVLNHPGEIQRWSRWCESIGARRPAFIHLDTAMNRLGLTWQEQEALAADPASLGTISVAGYLSHPSSADDAASPVLDRQRAAFDAIRAQLPSAPGRIANSPAMFRQAGRGLDIARPGCALYGVNPTPEADNPMECVISLHARVLQVRSVRRGDAVGYGGTATADRPMTIATLAIGYADGYLRSIGNRGKMVVNGEEVPVMGRVSMDLTTVDVTDLPLSGLAAGDWVEAIGPGMPVDRVAAAAGTIGYEILTDLGRRYHRRVVSS